MLRRGILWLSEQQRIHDFVRSHGLARRFATRFVAGETADAAIEAARKLASAGITASLDLLGESVTDPESARAARDEILALLELMDDEATVEANVSVKPSQLGLDLDPDLCRANFVDLLDRVRALSGFLRIDMEGATHTQRTLDLFERHLQPAYGDHVGVVIQSALRRSADDVDRLLALGARVRLCKGAYREASDIAFPDKRDVDRQYVALMERLLREGNYPAIATHDEAIIARAQRCVAREGIALDRFEFQMLHGVRRDLQNRLRASGYRVRVYIPFGTHWYPYLMRRLAERPANIAFILGNVIREGLSAP